MDSPAAPFAARKPPSPRPLMSLKHLSFHTAGESHGRGLVAVVEGVPAGLPLNPAADIDPDLLRRQGGYGRGRRMQIESDRAEIISGLRLGVTLGSPLSMVIWNRDWKNWTTAMALGPPQPDRSGRLHAAVVAFRNCRRLVIALLYSNRAT